MERDRARGFKLVNWHYWSVSGQGADDHVRFVVQTVATKDPVSNHVDVTPRPDFGVEGGNVLHGQFTTPGGHEALRPGAVEEDDGDEYRPDYTDQVSSFWNGLSEIQVHNEADVVGATGARFTLLKVFSPISL